MNSQVPNELISAYFDGEASPEERAEVERLLAENDESQRELNEISKISALLHSFPREFAPVTLASNVEERTNHMALPQPPRDPATRARERLRDWKAALVGGLATMLAVMAANSFNIHRPQNPMVASKSPALEPARAKQKIRTATPATVEEVASASISNGVAADSAVRDVPAPTVAAIVLPRDSSRGESDRGLKETAQLASDAAMNTAEAIVPSGPPKEDFVKNLQVGNLVQFADRETNVGLIDVNTVVDVDKAAGMLQALLIKHDVLPLAGNDKTGGNSVEKLAAKKYSQDDAVILVYTLATGEQYASTLLDVDQHPDLFKNWSNQQPLQLEQTLAEVNDSELHNPPASSEQLNKRADQAPVNVQAQLAVNMFLARNAQAAAANIENSGRRLNKDQKADRDGSKDAAVATGVPAGAMKGEGNSFGMQNARAFSAPAAANSKREPIGNAYQYYMRLDKNSAEGFPEPAANSSVDGPQNNPGQAANPVPNSIPRARSSYAKQPDAPARADTSNRLKMLWVLHPAPADAPTSATAPAPASEKSEK